MEAAPQPTVAPDGPLAGPATACAATRYQRREPEHTPLHRAVREHLATFLRDAAERSPSGLGLPGYVREEFQRYLRCGILAHGFARVHCGECGHDFLVGFSCKARGVCPSCNGRRMQDTAAHLTERVLPWVPVRQWVLSLPRWARWALVRDPGRVEQALGIALKAIFVLQRKRGRSLGVREPHCGAATFLQRFGGALNLNLHFHSLVPDGVFFREGDGVDFQPLRAPSQEELEGVLRKIVQRLTRLLRSDEEAADPDASDALGAAQRAELFALESPRQSARPPKGLVAQADGFSLHAGIHLHANNREGLARLCAYGARGPLAQERLHRLPDGRLLYLLKRALPDGRTSITLEPQELLRKLATLVPPPRRHLTRFHGVLAPHSALRALVVAGAHPIPEPTEGGAPGPAQPPIPAARPALDATPPRTPGEEAAPPRRPASRIPWAELLARVFKEDVLRCQRCGGRMRVLAFVQERSQVKKVLEHLGLPTTGPPMAPARSGEWPGDGHRGGDEVRDELPDYDA